MDNISIRKYITYVKIKITFIFSEVATRIFARMPLRFLKNSMRFYRRSLRRSEKKIGSLSKY